MKLPATERSYRNRVLVLQGGGALGSYQAGVYEGLVDAGIEPDWVAGISIGAINAALIAGNPPQRRVEQLHAFWDEVCQQPLLPAMPPLPSTLWPGDHDALLHPLRQWLSIVQSTRAVFEGQRGFFVPKLAPLPIAPHSAAPGQASYYDTAPLKATLLRLVDFDRINHKDAMRVSMGAVNVRSAELVYFDNREHPLRVEHVMASAALPPSFPAVEIDGEHYWDGGVMMNTPLFHVLMSEPRHDTLVFQVDLWNAEGEVPTSLPEVEARKKDILYSSRTRMINLYMRDQQDHRKAIANLLELLPPAQRDAPAARAAAALACDRRCNVQQLICADSAFEGNAKDYAFGIATMRRHWRSGLDDIARQLAQPGALDMPGADQPFTVHAIDASGSRGARDPSGIPALAVKAGAARADVRQPSSLAT